MPVVAQVYHALDNELDQAVPASAGLNQRISSLITARQAAERTAARPSGVMGQFISHFTGAGLGSLLGYEAGGSKGAAEGALIGGGRSGIAYSSSAHCHCSSCEKWHVGSDGANASKSTWNSIRARRAMMNPNLKPFKPGVSGNPAGKTKKPLVDRLLQDALSADDSADAKKIADKLISMAKHGSLAAIKLIAERTEGKPKRNADDSQKESGVQLTKEQINARLVELLGSPELKETVSKALFNSGEKVQ